MTIIGNDPGQAVALYGVHLAMPDLMIAYDDGRVLISLHVPDNVYDLVGGRVSTYNGSYWKTLYGEDVRVQVMRSDYSESFEIDLPVPS